MTTNQKREHASLMKSHILKKVAPVNKWILGVGLAAEIVFWASLNAFSATEDDGLFWRHHFRHRILADGVAAGQTAVSLIYCRSKKATNAFRCGRHQQRGPRKVRRYHYPGRRHAHHAAENAKRNVYSPFMNYSLQGTFFLQRQFIMYGLHTLLPNYITTPYEEMTHDIRIK